LVLSGIGVPFHVEFGFGEKSYPEAGNEDMDGEIFLRRGGSGEPLPAGKFLATIPRQEVTSKKETVLDRVNQLMSF
jgi:hypothetical protein